MVVLNLMRKKKVIEGKENYIAFFEFSKIRGFRYFGILE
jgi:hypothetical protein